MKLKVGDEFLPKDGTFHKCEYGNFIGRILKVDRSFYIWEVIEQGNGQSPVFKGNKKTTTEIEQADREFEFTLIHDSPLYKVMS
jgi:hypothetical protein